MGSTAGITTADGIYPHDKSSFYLKTTSDTYNSYSGFVEAIGI